ncbi:MAG: glycosyltransferase family 1 protein [Candidatus Latescibacteria bacterium]|nr:glycosyltransferase family 1 protein [Candidatus Latescibacterota bacterium]
MPAQKKIALFTDTYDQVNGVANTFKYLTQYSVKHNRRLDIYTHADGSDSIEERGTVRILRYKPTIPIDIYFDMIFDLKFPRFRILSECKKQNYDVIHTATPGSMGLNALIVAGSDIPLIGSYHTSIPEYVRERVEKIVKKFNLPTEHSGERSEDGTWEYMKWYYNRCRVVLAPSEHTKSTLEKKLNTKIRIFSRGIDIERFNPGFSTKHDGVIVLYVGRVSIEKNLGVLTKIFKNRSDAKLTIVGDGPYLAEMKSACPHAEFQGFLGGQDLSRAYASSDIFVFPSTTDTFGNVVLEAMSSGLPVIVTDKMGPKELVREGENGFIAADDEEFEKKLNILIEDKNLRQKMGANARDYAQSRSWDAEFDALYACYEEFAK